MLKGEKNMAICYNGLLKLLIDKGMNKTELCKSCGISSKTMSRIGKNQAISLDVIERICLRLNCRIEDVVEIKPDDVE